MKTSEVQFDEVRPMRTSEILRKAADEIRRRGWHQGDYGSDAGNFSTCAVCAMGAVRAVLSPVGDAWGGARTISRLKDENAAIVLLEKAIGGGITPIWNDTPGRKVEEVLEAFEEAAQKAEQDGD